MNGYLKTSEHKLMLNLFGERRREGERVSWSEEKNIIADRDDWLSTDSPESSAFFSMIFSCVQCCVMLFLVFSMARILCTQKFEKRIFFYFKKWRERWRENCEKCERVKKNLTTLIFLLRLYERSDPI
jgi:hypothetical protein